MSGQRTEGDLAAAARTLASLNEQAEALRAELRALQQELTQVREDFREVREAQLLEANEQLVLAALHSETVAETAVSALNELTRSSQRDALTNTPNRALMLDRLERAIAVARRRGTRSAVIFLDIDGFKKINDTLGHAVGDEVLQLVARRLEHVIRDSDNVSRHSGDEFLVLLPEIARACDAGRIARRMLSVLAAVDRVGDQAIHLSASLGIAIYPEDGDDPGTLIRRADAAMYRSKRRGNGSFAFYEERFSSGRREQLPALGP
jgi:diguanylate cyclase (GGDEF)-like protein